ncbi:MAG: LysM peptidoglycan-binding domain-containing protein [Chloroflexota bacterium]|nr:LysM peptidoglycan-binding domain-containing protein [Chloroflexota bacterium]
MTVENSGSNTKLCPTCGTQLSEGATRCLVCGSELTVNGETSNETSKALRGSQMPKVTLSLPVAVGLLAIFLAIGAVMVFFALQRTETEAAATNTPTVTITTTPSLTPTPMTPTLTATPLPSPTPFTYVVQDGDTCGGIAAAFDISVRSIVSANSLPADCATLYDGQELLIPHPTPTVTPFPSATLSGLEATIAACEKVAYKVQENDTLSSISTNYAVPMEAIKEFNGMINNTVYSGLNLIIPLCERAATPGPTSTPTVPPPYLAPNLLLPPDGTHFTLDDDIVTLQWAAVGSLRENEAYNIIIEDITEGQGRKLIGYADDTKFIVPASFRATANEPHVYRWWVTTARQVRTDENGEPVWDTAGAVSLKRAFTWTGEAPQVTPTP